MLTESDSVPHGFTWSPLRWLVAGEVLIFALVFAVAAELAIHSALAADDINPRLLASFGALTGMAAFALAMAATLHALGMHVVRSRRSPWQLLLKYLCSAGAAALLLWLLLGISPAVRADAGAIGTAIALGTALLILWRLSVSMLIDSNVLRRNVVVLGAGRAAGQFHDALRRRSDRRGIEIVGYLPLPGDTDQRIAPAHLLHSRVSLARLCERSQVSEIVVANDRPGDQRQADLPVRELLDCRFRGIGVTQAATFVERECERIPIELVEPNWWLYRRGFSDGMLKRAVKRAFDLVAAALILLPATPIMLACAFAIVVESGWRAPVLFRQTRVGRNGLTFRLVKFRSMREDAESDGIARWARSDDDRVTRVGQFLRKVRLDELPQLFNVLAGSMSLVGPRPERPEFVQDLARQIPYYDLRHSVRPGITGWAQLSYPYGASTRDAMEKLKFDLYYIKNHSIAFDLAILLRTVEVVLFGKGAR